MGGNDIIYFNIEIFNTWPQDFESPRNLDLLKWFILGQIWHTRCHRKDIPEKTPKDYFAKIVYSPSIIVFFLQDSKLGISPLS